MKQQYFGILSYELYESKKLESIIDFLSEKGICEKTEIHSYSGQLKETDRLGELHSRRKLGEISKGVGLNLT